MGITALRRSRRRETQAAATTARRPERHASVARVRPAGRPARLARGVHWAEAIMVIEAGTGSPHVVPPSRVKDGSHYAEVAVLKDGESILVRAIRPADKPLLQGLHSRLSFRSIRQRYFGAKGELTPADLAYLTELDFDSHVGLVACVREDGVERIAGVARYLRTSPPGADETSAEFAATVADQDQGRGIGTLLLEHLTRVAREHGVDTFEAEVMADNAQMMDVFTQSGFAVRQSMDDGIFHVTFPISESARFVEASVARERHAAAESVRVFFEPRSVAVIGASRQAGSIGHALVTNLKACGFRGPIYPVNAAATTIEGLPCYPSVEAVPGPIDLAVVAVPAAAVEGVVTACAAVGVRGVVVISSGFAEVSAEGRAVQQRIARFVRASGMRMVGPNCMGVLNADPAVSLNATFAPGWPPPGNVSFLTQSGALGLAMLDHAAQLNIGVAGFVSVGNKSDVSGNDLLSYWAEDPHTSVIALYLESFGNPRKFARIAPEVARKKPIIAVKSGRSAAGTRAAQSHSAALASLDVGVDALFAQAGVIRTNTLEELFDAVALLANQPIPAGPRVGVVTNAGGPGILLADACEARGLSLPALAPATVAALREMLPPHAGLANPVDLIASASPEQFERAVALVGADANVDSLVVIYIPPLVTKPEDVAAAVARAAGQVPAHKPIATVFMSSKGAPPMLSNGPRGRIPSYSFPENVALALSAATRYGRWRERPRGAVITLDRSAERDVRRLVEGGRARLDERGWLALPDAAAILARAGIELAPFEQTPPDAEAAARAAERLGFPIVLKAVATGLLHKSEVGGVVIGLRSREAVRAAAVAMLDRLRAAKLTPEGLIVQAQIDGGVEALVGVTSDPTMGPLVVAGLGGVQVELLRDVAMRLPPVSDLDAEEMLAGLRSAKLLDGFRGAPAADRGALAQVIRRVSALVDVLPELAELDLNPVKVLAPGEGAVALDVRMRLAP